MSVRSLDACHIHVGHILIKVCHDFYFLPRLSTDKSWRPGSFVTRFVPTVWTESLQSNGNHCIVRLRSDNIMNAHDEEVVFSCMLSAYIQSLCQQKEDQQQLRRGKARVQQAGRRRMRRPRSMSMREWLSKDRRQQLGHYSTFLIRELRTELSEDASRTLRLDPGKIKISHRKTRHEVSLCPTAWTEAASDWDIWALASHYPMRSGAVKQPSAIWWQKCARPSWKPTRMWRPMNLFVCVDVLRPSQRNGIMSSAVDLLNHTCTGQA